MLEKLNDLRTYIGVAITAFIGLSLGGWVEGDAETVQTMFDTISNLAAEIGVALVAFYSLWRDKFSTPTPAE